MNVLNMALYTNYIVLVIGPFVGIAMVLLDRPPITVSLTQFACSSKPTPMEKCRIMAPLPLPLTGAVLFSPPPFAIASRAFWRAQALMNTTIWKLVMTAAWNLHDQY